MLPIQLTRTYRPRDTVSRPFGIGATHPYAMFLVGNTNPYTWLNLFFQTEVEFIMNGFLLVPVSPMLSMSMSQRLPVFTNHKYLGTDMDGT